MKLLSVEIGKSAGCDGLLDGLQLYIRTPQGAGEPRFEPICLLGPNGTGKSQFLQTLAEIFQAAWYACAPREERRFSITGLDYSVEYQVWPADAKGPRHVRIRPGKAAGTLSIETQEDGEWVGHDPAQPETRALLPTKIIGYTSGENETLSVPFFVSRAGYAEEVTTRAIPSASRKRRQDFDETIDPPEPRLMLIDYGTHLEVLVANLLLGTEAQKSALLGVAKLNSLRSVRCVVQLANGPKVSASIRKATGRKGVQLTDELAAYIENLKSCATCWDYEAGHEVYTFDYWCDGATTDAFKSFFSNAFELYRALHKLALLNDLAISRSARKRFERDIKSQRFAARLPEPPDEDKVFRFEQVTFCSTDDERTVDYVSLSDGEHQLVEILGVFAMIAERNVLFLLDEPESHFNPQWRVAFMSRLRRVPTLDGDRNASISAAAQEVLLTTHAPFVPSDMPRENVIIFERSGHSIAPRSPDIQTYGASFEEILEHCFMVEPPISELARTEINGLLDSSDIGKIETTLQHLGPSVEKVILAAHLNQLKS